MDFATTTLDSATFWMNKIRREANEKYVIDEIIKWVVIVIIIIIIIME